MARARHRQRWGMVARAAKSRLATIAMPSLITINLRLSKSWTNPRKKSDLLVIVKAKDLCAYVITVTQKSPKQFRFTFTSRLQNLTLDIIDSLMRANDIFLQKGDIEAMKLRQGYQHSAMSSLRILSFFSMLSMEQKCILPKQYEMIASYSAECQSLLGGWINSDKRRFGE